jgi:hypothetical protein
MKAKKGEVGIHTEDGSLSVDGSLERWVWKKGNGNFKDENYEAIPITSTFDAVLSFNGVNFTNLTTRGKYHFFDSFKNDLITKNILHYGIIVGKWGYMKLGNRYSIYLIEQYL